VPVVRRVAAEGLADGALGVPALLVAGISRGMESADERDWLIERSGPLWWAGSGWTAASADAVRFARRRDAEAVVLALAWCPAVYVTEHVWCAPAAPSLQRLLVLGRSCAGEVTVPLGPDGRPPSHLALPDFASYDHHFFRLTAFQLQGSGLAEQWRPFGADESGVVWAYVEA